MKDVNIIKAKREKDLKAQFVSGLLRHLAAAAVGFILCKAVFFENYLPFGVAFMAGCPVSLLPSAALGIFVGYFLPAFGITGFKYVAAALAVLAVRFMLIFNKKLISNPLFAGLISALAVGVTGAVARFGVKSNPLYFALEITVCAVCAIVISRVSSFIYRVENGLSGEELGCLLVGFSLLLSGVYGASLFGLRPSCVLAVLLILSAAKYGGAVAAMSGAISVSCFFFFAGKSAAECFAYTIAAFCAGLVCAYGKYVQLSSFFAACVFFCVIKGISAQTAIFITEAALGCLVFALLP
ncbi:MAG: hypothetical protein J6T73_00595, partial [Clostridia bacterium]|nr:hypothetical protein [Clostridia bacterium]